MSTLTRPDRRTVGDLLLHADIAARQSLLDPSSRSAAARVRSWGEVVEAAAEVWAAIPDRAADPSMSLLHRLATGVHRSTQRSGWPGPGDTDPDLDLVVEHLTRAANLVRRRTDPQSWLGGAAHLDSEAARTRLMHVVYVSAHGVALSLRDYRDQTRRVLAARRRLAPGQSLDEPTRLLARIDAAERLAAAYLHGRWPTAMGGQHRPAVEPDRLQRAVTEWDVQARRTLAGTPGAADVLYVVMVERDLTVSGGHVLAAAADLGRVDLWQYKRRLVPALDGLDAAWADLGHLVGQMTGRARRVDADLRGAGGELHAALREITADLGGIASPTTMAQRTDLDTAVRQVRGGWVAAIDLGQVLRDVARNPGLTGPARLVPMEDEPGLRIANDLPANRSTLPSERLRWDLASRSDTVTRAALGLDRAAAAALDQPRAAEPRADGRRHHDRIVLAGPSPDPRVGPSR